MPTAYGAEFRQDVIVLTRNVEAPVAKIGTNFGLSATTPNRWIVIVELEKSGADATESAERSAPIGRQERSIQRHSANRRSGRKIF